MNRNDWESPLRAAKPTESEIVPLSPEASNRILFAALRENRRRKMPLWFAFATPWRTLISTAAVTGIAYCLIPHIGTSDSLLMQDATVTPDLSRAYLEKEDIVKTVPSALKTTKIPPHGPAVPPLFPKPLTPSVLLAREPILDAVRTKHHEKNPLVRIALSENEETARNRTLRSQARMPRVENDEGDMYVAVSGDNILPPENDPNETLTVTVVHNVPDSVSGHAEAAGLQAIPVSGATPTPGEEQLVPVWAHVRVESGQEPEMTLTALH